MEYAQSGANVTLVIPREKTQERIDRAPGGNVIFELSGVGDVTNVTIPSDALSQFARAGLGIIVRYDGAEILLDSAVLSQTQYDTVNISIKKEVVAPDLKKPKR